MASSDARHRWTVYPRISTRTNLRGFGYCARAQQPLSLHNPSRASKRRRPPGGLMYSIHQVGKYFEVQTPQATHTFCSRQAAKAFVRAALRAERRTGVVERTTPETPL